MAICFYVQFVHLMAPGSVSVPFLVKVFHTAAEKLLRGEVIVKLRASGMNAMRQVWNLAFQVTLIQVQKVC